MPRKNHCAIKSILIYINNKLNFNDNWRIMTKRKIKKLKEKLKEINFIWNLNEKKKWKKINHRGRKNKQRKIRKINREKKRNKAKKKYKEKSWKKINKWKKNKSFGLCNMFPNFIQQYNFIFSNYGKLGEC